MQGIRLCSPQAKIPYHIEDMELNIYSVEELAYYLYQIGRASCRERV